MASTHWDSRNRGFIPPSQLRQLNQSAVPPHDYTQQQQPEQHQLTQTRPSSMATSSPLRPAPTPTASTSNHSRSSSLFSFRSKSSPLSPSQSSIATSSNKLTRQQQPHQQQIQSPLAKQQPTLPQLDPTSPLDPDGSTPQPQWQQPQQPPPQQPQSQPQIRRRSFSASDSPPLHPEIRSIVSLTIAHTQKIYYSGPLVRKLERQSDGLHPANDSGWRDVWVQLYGTTLSIWDMKEVKEASEQGKEVPPSYINITEAFVQVVRNVTQPATANTSAQEYSNVITLNTAGSNLILFSCPTAADMISWAAALRLSSWEKSRLEEIYTAHLIRITLNDGRNTPTPLIHGSMEGWVRIRVAGQTDWKRLWMVLSSGSSRSQSSSDQASPPSRDGRTIIQPASSRKKRISSLFSRDRSLDRPAKSMMTLFASPKSKDKKIPLLSFEAVTQAFAVYPERPKLISSSTLIKLEGTYGQQELAGSMRFKQGWMLFMPDLEGARNPGGEMLKWLIGIHDAFELYGRPKMYVWDPRDSISMMFAYPIGENKDLLFLDREFAETLDFREDRIPIIRSNLLNIIVQRMRGVAIPMRPVQSTPQIPPPEETHSLQQSRAHQDQDSLPQLPPWAFGSSGFNHVEQPPAVPEKRTLTPINERNGREGSGSRDQEISRKPPPVGSATEAIQGQQAFLDNPVSTSPLLNTEPHSARKSIDSGRMGTGSRPDSKLDHTFGRPGSTDGMSVRSIDPSNVNSQGSPNPDRSTISPQPGQGLRMTGLRSNSRLGTLNSVQSQHSAGQQAELVPGPNRFAQQTSPGMESVLPNSCTSQQNLSNLSAPFSPSSAISLPSPYSMAAISAAPASPELPSSPPPPMQQSQASQLPPPEPAQSPEEHDIMNEAGALYYMQALDESTVPIIKRKPPVPDSESEESESSPSSDRPIPYPVQPSPLHLRKKSDPSSSVLSPRSGGSKSSASGKTPAAARGRADKFNVDQSQPSSRSDNVANAHQMVDVHRETNPHLQSLDENADALAALTFLENDDAGKAVSHTRELPQPPPPPPPPVHVSPPAEDQGDGSENSVHGSEQYKSSFAPSKKAAERMAKSQAQQAAHQAAVSKPGRSNVRPRVKNSGTWNESSDEEEDDEGDEEEEEDVDSDGEPAAPQRSVAHDHSMFVSSAHPSGNGRQSSPYGSTTDFTQRPPRHLPQPTPRLGYGVQEGSYHGHSPRHVSNQYSDAGRSHYHDEGSRRASPQPQLRAQSEFPPPGAAQQSVWSQVLEPGKVAPERDTFVHIEPPSQTMTKAFTPHGLLSAGLQDKQGRSAKRQEELAKETGASLVNVPNKPPPPQTGLLGAVSAHERDRKREGGIGAALTERERDRRLAEERQRKLDEFQRQQLEMAQTGSMYGGPGPQFTGFNPMMANPMMMGMNPMNPMMQSGWGFPQMNPMMSGFGSHSQPMLAAQQAALQAYQQTMMAYSQAGSQTGDMGGIQNMPGMQPMNPMMTGGSMFDPRMSMMGMPMMGVNSGMGQMGVMPPLGMQMTGVSGFDPRFSASPSQFDFIAQQRVNSSSPGHSPAPQGSPAGPRPIDVADQPFRSSANASPHPQTKT